jgi:adenosylcobinamide-GDP ribazoletransferase
MSQLDNLIPDASQQHLAADLVEDASLWESFIAAVQFLTRLPLATKTPVTSGALQRSPRFFPLVGAFIGLFTATVIGFASSVWPIWIAVLVALAIELRLTGAMHEDGVADFCDAFGGGWTREETLLILKDSRIGTYGALGLLLAVVLRAATTIEIVSRFAAASPLIWGSALIASSVIGRWVTVFGMFWVLPIPQRESLSRDIGGRLRTTDLLLASLTGMPFVVCFAYFQPMQCLAAFILVVPSVAWFLFRVKRRLGGITGDCLGCIGYVSQVLVLLAVAMEIDFWSNHS